MKTNHELKKIKLVFCFIILLSNASIYLLMTDDGSGQTVNESYFREDHITIKIKAELLVPFSTRTPVTLVSKSSIIKNVFLLQEVQSSKVSIQDSLSNTNDYFIEVHKNEFDKIKKSISFKIYPNEVTQKLSNKKRGVSYEINY